MRRSGMALAFTVALVSAVSCRPVDRLGFTPVEGRVTLDGKPIEVGEVRFVPDEGKGNKGPMSSSPLNKDGRYSLRGPGVRVGAIPGAHVAYLVSPDPYAASEPMILIDGTFTMADGVSKEPNRPRGGIPPCFLAPETSGMTADVAAGRHNVLNFDLVSPARPRKAPSR